MLNIKNNTSKKSFQKLNYKDWTDYWSRQYV